MQISASYDFDFVNDTAAEKAAAVIETILSNKDLDVWTPTYFGNKVMTYAEHVDWDIYEDLVMEFVKQIAITMPDQSFSGTSEFINMSVGQSYGIKIAYSDGILKTESGVNILKRTSRLKHCPYCGEEYDVEAIQADIDVGEFPLAEDGSFNCFQCDMQISMEELTEDGGPSVSATYELKDGNLTLVG